MNPWTDGPERPRRSLQRRRGYNTLRRFFGTPVARKTFRKGLGTLYIVLCHRFRNSSRRMQLNFIKASRPGASKDVGWCGSLRKTGTARKDVHNFLYWEPEFLHPMARRTMNPKPLENPKTFTSLHGQFFSLGSPLPFF